MGSHRWGARQIRAHLLRLGSSAAFLPGGHCRLCLWLQPRSQLVLSACHSPHKRQAPRTIGSPSQPGFPLLKNSPVKRLRVEKAGGAGGSEQLQSSSAHTGQWSEAVTCGKMSLAVTSDSTARPSCTPALPELAVPRGREAAADNEQVRGCTFAAAGWGSAASRRSMRVPQLLTRAPVACDQHVYASFLQPAGSLTPMLPWALEGQGLL